MRGGVVSEADCAMLIGSRRLSTSRATIRIRLRSSEYWSIAPEVLGGIERFVAINSAIKSTCKARSTARSPLAAMSARQAARPTS